MAFAHAGQFGPEVSLSSADKLLPATPFTVFLTDGVTPATLYTDRTAATTTPNPSATDSLGNLTFYAQPGQYKVSCNGVTLSVTVPVDPADVLSGDTSGTVTNVSSTDAGITIATPTTTPAITPIYGTAAHTIAQGNDSRIVSALQTAADASLVVAGTTITRGALTGDVTAAQGANATTLKNTGPGATGPIGDATHSPAVTIDAQGRVTALTSTTITGNPLLSTTGSTPSATTSSTTSVALGNAASASGAITDGIAIGTSANVSATDGIAIGGSGPVAQATHAIAIGTAASATNTRGAAIGAGTSSSADGAWAIGTDSSGTGAASSVTNRITLGTTSHTVHHPGKFTTAPATSSAPTLALGTAYQNTLGYDILLVVYLSVTVNTSGVIKLGVGSTNTPTQQTIVTGVTTVGFLPVPIYLPNNYYALLSITGTITDSITGQIAMPV